MELDVRDLQMVAAIAASGSVTRAAGELHRTQSAVSHRLRGIEERLGARLFLRVGKRMLVTAAGERVLATAQRVLEDIKAAEEHLRRLGTRQVGVVRVCAQCNTGYHWLPPLVDAFHRRHPDVEVSLALDCTIRPVESLLEGSSTSRSSRNRSATTRCESARYSRTSTRRSCRPIIHLRSGRS
jgi:LysR family transcriptional regulator for metE and metH